MTELVVLGGSDAFCRLLGGRELLAPVREPVKLAAVMPHCPLPPWTLCCDTLLLWNEEAERLLPHIAAQSLVSCGFAACCTLTLSSMEDRRGVLTVQRSFRRPDGNIVLPQDILLKEWWYGITAEEQIMWAGLRLLRGEM